MISSSAGGNRGIDTSHRNRRPRENGFDNHAARAAAEGLAPGGHFIQHETERENIRARVEIVSANLLGRHVGRSAADDSDDRSGILIGRRRKSSPALVQFLWEPAWRGQNRGPSRVRAW